MTSRFTKIFLTAILFVSGAPAFAQDTKAPAPVAPAVAPSVPDAERLKIETIVKQLLQREPQIVMDAAQNYQAKQREIEMAKAAGAIKENSAKLNNDPNSPVSGNPKGDVTVVEFFDYNCGYCKRAHPTTTQLKKEDTNVRYVYKQFPILGPTSLTAAQAAVAAHLQGKFEAMHDALMNNKEPLSESVIDKMAGEIKGLDVAKFKKDMAGDEVRKRIDADLELGRSVGVQGTPGFVIKDQLHPGAMDIAQFKKLVAEAREAKKP